MRIRVEYSIIVYVSGVPDAERTWVGTDVEEAERHRVILANRFPRSVLRFTVSTYFDPGE